MTPMITDEREVAPNTPPDWRDWVNDFPSIKSIALLCVLGWLLSPFAMTAIGWLVTIEVIKGAPTLDFILKMLDRWLDALYWLTGAAVLGVVGKRATEKPDLVRAEGEVRAATIVAAAKAKAIAPGMAAVGGQSPAKAQPVTGPHPNTDPAIVAVIEGEAAKQREIERILAEEAQAKQQRQAGTIFEDG
jgi:hypothetical protein